MGIALMRHAKRISRLLVVLSLAIPVTVISSAKVEPAAAAALSSTTFLPLVVGPQRQPQPQPKPQPTPQPQPQTQIYWGALVGTGGHIDAPSPGNMQPGGPVDTFEKQAKKGMSILHWGLP
jgi:hypothetical protein